MPDLSQQLNRSQIILKIFRSIAMPFTWALCVSLVVLVSVAAYRWAMEARYPPPSSVGSPALADLNKQIDESIDRRIKYDQALVDKLVVLVGIYTTILSFLALGTVLLNRQDAKEQIENARKKIEELQETIERDFPEIGKLHESIQELMQRLEAILPDEKNWRESSYSDLTPGEREDILTKEFTIGALGIFAPKQSLEGRKSLARIFVALSRFYLGKFVAEKNLTDAERAKLYATKSIELDPSGSVAYRQRGSIYSYLFNREQSVALPASQTRELTEHANKLLHQAEDDFRICQKNDRLDAGSYYNIALLWYYRGSLKNAIDVSQELLKIKGDISWNHRQKYLPDTYINLACFYAKQADSVPGSAEGARLRGLAVATCETAYEELSGPASTEASRNEFLSGVERELQESNDFRNLGDSNRKRLFALLGRKNKPPGDATPTGATRLSNWWSDLQHWIKPH